MTTSKGSRSRRTIATLTWAGLVATAAFLWYARLHGTIRSATTEPIALLLSAYAAFSSIFAWMLFSPNRRSNDESPALFLAGGITLLPPCIISYCIMPPDSPLRGWLTIGVFLLTVIAVMSPVPDEFFAVPRDRSTYLKPISDAMFTSLDVLDVPQGFDQLQLPEFRRSTPLQPYSGDTVEWRGEAKDPWVDPFRGTGIEPIQPAGRRRARPTADARPPAPAADSEKSGIASAAREAAESIEAPSEKTSGSTSGQIPSGAPRPLPGTRQPGSEIPAAYRSLTSQRPAAAFGFRTATATVVNSRPTPASSFVAAPVSLPAPVDIAAAVPPPVPEREGLAHRVLSRERKPQSRGETVSHLDDHAVSIPVRQPAAPVSPNHELTRSQATDSATAARLHASDESTTVSGTDALSVERLRDEFGGEMVEGTIRVFFEAGQKRANLHVPFSPPLPGIPEVECEAVGHDALRLKVPVRQPYGIRIEARRSDATAALETEIGFAAVCSPRSRPA